MVEAEPVWGAIPEIGPQGLALAGGYVPNPHFALDMVWGRWYVQPEL